MNNVWTKEEKLFMERHDPDFIDFRKLANISRKKKLIQYSLILTLLTTALLALVMTINSFGAILPKQNQIPKNDKPVITVTVDQKTEARSTFSNRWREAFKSRSFVPLKPEVKSAFNSTQKKFLIGVK